MDDQNKYKTVSSEGHLDITNIPNEDGDMLADRIETFYKNDGTVKMRLSYAWDRNQRFLDGDQWLVFDGDRESGGVWKRLTVSKANEYIPRPVTNYIFDVYQTLKSYLLKNKPRSTVRPNTATFKDKAAAKVAELCLEANWEKLSEERNYEYAAACMLTYGTVFKKDYWDTASLAMVRIPKMSVQPQIDPQSGQVIGQHEVQDRDPMTGELMFEEIPLGDVNSEIIEPYRIALDPQAPDLHKIRWIMEYSIQPLSWIEETYDKQLPGYTGRALDVKAETKLSGSMQRWYQLKNSSGVKGGNALVSGGIDGNTQGSLNNSAVLKEYYERPSAKFPKGRMVVVANGVTLYAGDSPYSGPEFGDWHPFSECRWELVPGRFWGKSPLDFGVEIQKQINSIDSVIILTRKTMAIPQKLVPMSSGVTPGQWTGRPGQEIYFRDSGGAKPELLPAMGVDQTVFKEREQRLEDLKNVTGAIDILKGDRPPGVTAASALNLLYEVGTGKLYPILDRWKKFVEMSQKKQLKIIAKMYKEPREEYTKLLKMKNTELSEEAINKFIGADLYDNCNVSVEAGSNIPKLQAAKQLALQEAAQAGTLNLELPANRMEYNRQMGLVGFDNDVGPDIKRQEWENDLLENIENSPDNMPIVLDVDDDQVHMDVLSRRMKEPSFMDVSAQVQQAFMQHYSQHMESKNKKEMAQQMQAMATGQPPQEQPDANAPQPVSGRGKGLTEGQANAIRPDANVPGAIGEQQ